MPGYLPAAMDFVWEMGGGCLLGERQLGALVCCMRYQPHKTLNVPKTSAMCRYFLQIQQKMKIASNKNIMENIITDQGNARSTHTHAHTIIIW